MDEKPLDDVGKRKENFFEAIGPDFRAYYANRVAITISLE